MGTNCHFEERKRHIFKSEESDNSGTEKDTNRANGSIERARTVPLYRTGVMKCMNTGPLLSQTEGSC